MKMWSCVYLYGGLINEVKIFKTKEKAYEWFKSITDAAGGWTVCDEGDYEVSEKVMKFYDSLGREDTEVYCEFVEVE